MKSVIVDTNVAMVANGDCEGVRPECRLQTIDFLEKLLQKGRIAIDLEGEIEEEYWRRLSIGQPGVGSRFMQKFFSEALDRIDRIKVRGHGNNRIDFAFDGNLRRFDQINRKFVRVAAATGFIIFNATDSDWVEHGIELSKRGIKIQHLCGAVTAAWFV